VHSISDTITEQILNTRVNVQTVLRHPTQWSAHFLPDFLASTHHSNFQLTTLIFHSNHTLFTRSSVSVTSRTLSCWQN